MENCLKGTLFSGVVLTLHWRSLQQQHPTLLTRRIIMRIMQFVPLHSGVRISYFC